VFQERSLESLHNPPFYSDISSDHYKLLAWPESLVPTISQSYLSAILGFAYSLVELGYACAAFGVLFYLVVVRLPQLFVLFLLYCRSRLA
jgi:sorbitol-specific phosphotransferase system component IIC